MKQNIYFNLFQDKIILTMKRIRRELDVMTHLREVQDNDYDSPENPLFLTWPISKFGMPDEKYIHFFKINIYILIF